MTDVAASGAPPPLADAEAGPFFGHPKGLAFLAFTEAWERFSYYGMTALVVLYMVNELLLPGHVENIAGFEGFRGFIESLYGPLSTQALASAIFGLYSGFVYFTPLLGGLVADRWIGQRNAVVLGALAMSGGHVAMAFEQSFLVALLLLVTGSGLLKGNISAQVGALYPIDAEARRTRAFAIFSTAINIGAVAGPVVCGLLAQLYGWHVGFGAAALLMLLALATYLAGYRHLPARIARAAALPKAPLTRDEKKAVAALIAVMVISIFQSVSYYQLANVMPVWAQDHVDWSLAGMQLPVPWLLALDSFFSILCVPVLFALWGWQAKRGREAGDLQKIGIGAWMAAGSNLILVAAILAYGDARVPGIWVVLYTVGMGVAFIYYWPTLLALVSRSAPAAINATMMGLTFCTLFIGNNLIGWLGGYYEPLGPTKFWLLHAAIGAGGGLSVLLFGRSLARILSRTSLQPLRPSAMTLETER